MITVWLVFIISKSIARIHVKSFPKLKITIPTECLVLSNVRLSNNLMF